MTKRWTVVGVGEILWDIFPDGPRFGGAPANFACTAAGLGGDRVRVLMVSGVGRDDLGRRALTALEDHAVDTTLVRQYAEPTGQVFVEVDQEGRASYRFAENTAWDQLQWSDELAELADRADVVCWGSLGQRSSTSQATIQRFVAGTRESAYRIFDINLRRPHYTDAIIRSSLEAANVLKLNDDELPFLAQLCGKSDARASAARPEMSGREVDIMRRLAHEFQLDVVALTRGPRGATLVRGDQVSQQPGQQTQVSDTVGAGDAFTATLALGLLNQIPLDTINRQGCAVAAYVCSQSGATPEIPSHVYA